MGASDIGTAIKITSWSAPTTVAAATSTMPSDVTATGRPIEGSEASGSTTPTTALPGSANAAGPSAVETSAVVITVPLTTR